jgi:hypothetical protein
MYEQTLYKVIKDHIKPKVIDRMNRYKKWEYGYNKEHDVVIISRTGEIGEIYEIQNLKIALPKAKDVHKFENDKWEYTEYPKELKKIKSVFDWEQYPIDFREKWYDYIDNEFNKRDQGFWFYNKNVATYVLLALIICTCSGVKSTSVNQISGNQIDYFLYSGKPVRLTHDLMGCAILRIDVVDFRLCPQQRRSIMQQLHLMHGSVSCQSLVPMLKRCSQTRSYRYRLTTRSFSNQYRTVWTGQKPNSLIEYRQRNTQDESLKLMNRSENLTVLTRPLTGKTQATTRMTGKN